MPYEFSVHLLPSTRGIKILETYFSVSESLSYNQCFPSNKKINKTIKKYETPCEEVEMRYKTDSQIFVLESLQEDLAQD